MARPVVGGGARMRRLSARLHALLAPYALAFLLGALAFDLIGVEWGRAGWSAAAKYLEVAGLVLAVVVALPGAVALVLPSAGRVRWRRGLLGHVVLEMAALAAYALACWVRGAPGVAPDPPIIWLELLGAACLIWAQWLGVRAAGRARRSREPA